MTMNEIIEKLEKVRTPIVYDAIEKFNLRSTTEFYTDDTIKCIYPEKGAMCGFACTSKITGAFPALKNEHVVPSREVWKYVYSSRRPTIMVCEDIDSEPKRNCAWGDYTASIFYALGCKGCLTNGFVRDVDIVKDFKFKFFARNIIVGHGNNRTKEIDIPVQIGGMPIYPGDLIHMDVHGAIVIPNNIDLIKLLEYVDKCLHSEDEVIRYCQGNDFNLDGLFAVVDEHEKRSGIH